MVYIILQTKPLHIKSLPLCGQLEMMFCHRQQYEYCHHLTWWVHLKIFVYQPRCGYCCLPCYWLEIHLNQWYLMLGQSQEQQYRKMNNLLKKHFLTSCLQHHPIAETTKTDDINQTLILQLQPFYGSLEFAWDNPGEPVPEETFTHSHLSWSSIIPYLLLPSIMNQ